jgi:hypothetical protein
LKAGGWESIELAAGVEIDRARVYRLPGEWAGGAGMRSLSVSAGWVEYFSRPLFAAALFTAASYCANVPGGPYDERRERRDAGCARRRWFG